MPDRVPCPHCAERIMPGAKFCRFCRKPVTSQTESADSMFPPVDENQSNVPAIIALPLAILAWPVCGAIFLLVFESTRFLQSMKVGAIVAAAAMGCGITGLLLATRTRKKTSGLLLSISSITIAGLALVSFMVTAILIGKLSNASSGSSANQSSGEQAPSAIKQILGTGKPTTQPMKCTQCDHEFEISSAALFRQQALKDYQAIVEGAQDVNAMLDKYQAGDTQGYPCPNCNTRSAWPLVTCPHCSTSFVADKTAMSGSSAVCPQCGASIPLMTGLPGTADLENLLNSMP